MRGGFGALALALALHVVAAVVSVDAAALQPAQSRGDTRVLQVRLMQAPAAAPAAIGSRQDAGEETAMAVPSPPAASPAPEVAPSRVLPVSAEAPSDPAAPAAAEAGGEGEDVYLPRRLLSVGPRVRQPPLIAYPDDAPQAGRFVGVLALFIDDDGTVRRVRVERGPLPATLESAARAAFLGARFSPGEVDGVSVKSLIHVEVVFEARPPVL